MRLPCLSLSQKYLLRTRSISEPFFHDERQNGPLPSGFPARPLSPTFLAYVCETTAVPQRVRYDRKLALAVGSLMTTRLFDGASTFMSAGYCQLTMAFLALARLKENATSWAVICEPSQNFACGNRSKVNVLPSFEIFQVFAMYGWKPVPSGVAMTRLAFVWYAAQRLSFSLMWAGSHMTASAARAARSVPPSTTVAADLVPACVVPVLPPWAAVAVIAVAASAAPARMARPFIAPPRRTSRRPRSDARLPAARSARTPPADPAGVGVRIRLRARSSGLSGGRGSTRTRRARHRRAGPDSRAARSASSSTRRPRAVLTRSEAARHR